MERVKIFFSTNDPERLESLANDWLEHQGNSIEITRVRVEIGGNMDHHAYLVVFYKKT